MSIEFILIILFVALAASSSLVGKLLKNAADAEGPSLPEDTPEPPQSAESRSGGAALPNDSALPHVSSTSVPNFPVYEPVYELVDGQDKKVKPAVKTPAGGAGDGSGEKDGKRGSKIDKKKLVIYSEIMRPKYKG